MTGTRGELRFRAVGVLGKALLRGLMRTTRVSAEGEESFLRFRREGRPVIFVCWHGQLLPLVHQHRNQGVVVLVSEHADGEFVARVLERHGFGTARGSSTRGGSRGLGPLIRPARAGRDLALPPDGPRGPARKVKPGALLAAQVTGLPLIPLAAGASSAWRLGSWDGFMIPRPFARVSVRYGAPHWIERDAGEEALARHALALESTLNELSAAVSAEAAARSAGASRARPA